MTEAALAIDVASEGPVSEVESEFFAELTGASPWTKAGPFGFAFSVAAVGVGTCVTPRFGGRG